MAPHRWGLFVASSHFDYFWAHPGDGDYLTVFFGNNLLFPSLGLDFSGTEFKNSGLIYLALFAGQTDQLLFWLNSVGDPNAEIDIRDLTFHVSTTFETPLPGALPLFATGLGALGLLGWRRKRKQAA